SRAADVGAAGGHHRQARGARDRGAYSQRLDALPAQPHPPGGSAGRGPATGPSRRRQGPGRRPRNRLSLPRHGLLAADDRAGTAGRSAGERNATTMTRRRLTVDTPTGPVTITAEN